MRIAPHAAITAVNGHSLLLKSVTKIRLIRAIIAFISWFWWHMKYALVLVFKKMTNNSETADKTITDFLRRMSLSCHFNSQPMTSHHRMTNVSLTALHSKHQKSTTIEQNNEDHESGSRNGKVSLSHTHRKWGWRNWHKHNKEDESFTKPTSALLISLRIIERKNRFRIFWIETIVESCTFILCFIQCKPERNQNTLFTNKHLKRELSAKRHRNKLAACVYQIYAPLPRITI